MKENDEKKAPGIFHDEKDLNSNLHDEPTNKDSQPLLSSKKQKPIKQSFFSQTSSEFDQPDLTLGLKRDISEIITIEGIDPINKEVLFVEEAKEEEEENEQEEFKQIDTNLLNEEGNSFSTGFEEREFPNSFGFKKINSQGSVPLNKAYAQKSQLLLNTEEKIEEEDAEDEQSDDSENYENYQNYKNKEKNIEAVPKQEQENSNEENEEESEGSSGSEDELI